MRTAEHLASAACINMRLPVAGVSTHFATSSDSFMFLNNCSASASWSSRLAICRRSVSTCPTQRVRRHHDSCTTVSWCMPMMISTFAGGHICWRCIGPWMQGRLHMHSTCEHAKCAQITVEMRPFDSAHIPEIIVEAALIGCCTPCAIVEVRSRNHVAPAVAAS